MVETDDTLLNQRAYNYNQVFNRDFGDDEEEDNPNSSSLLTTRTAPVGSPE
jgi:hypothetical protein